MTHALQLLTKYVDFTMCYNYNEGHQNKIITVIKGTKSLFCLSIVNIALLQ